MRTHSFNRRVRHRKKGIGELLAVIIVIAITIVAGLVLYSFVMGKISMFGNSAGLEVETAQITNGVVLLTVKNTGTYTFTQISFKIYINGAQQGSAQTISLPSGGLAPGQSASFTGSFSSITGTSEQPGTVYTIVITGTYGNNQNYTVSTNVVGT